jgi:hypothetical protein
MVGKDAGHGALTGDSNTFVGREAGMGVTSGYSNVAMGQDAGRGISSGYWNVYIGANCGTTGNGSANVGIGNQVLETGAHGDNNVAIGWSVGEDFTGTQSTFIGGESARQATSTDASVAIGYNAMGEGVTTGDNNTIVGAYAGKVLTSSVGNTIMGKGAGIALTSTNSYNTLIGYEAGQALTAGGEYNVVIGSGTEPNGATNDFSITIGANAVGSGNSTVFFGQSSSYYVYTTFGNGTWSQSSDERLKENIADSTAGLSFINDLRPRTFKWRKAKDVGSVHLREYEEGSDKYVKGDIDNDGTHKTWHGFIAQEVQTTINAHSEVKDGNNIVSEIDVERVPEGETGTLGMSEGDLIPMLTKAIQELSAKNDALEARIATLEG